MFVHRGRRFAYHPSVMDTQPSPDILDLHDAGVAGRRAVARSAHAQWSPPPDRADPVQVLIDQGRNRIASLLPLRYARMRADPFAFLRGAAAIMAGDLAHTPASGLAVQSCGDCHLANFGSYATPEGIAVFDVNDFDETLPAPFEWDVKRLATSLAVAGRTASHADPACRKLARMAVRSYRRHMAELAELSPIAAWSTRIDLVGTIGEVEDDKLRRRLHRHLDDVLSSGKAHFGLVEKTAKGWAIKETSPLVARCAAYEAEAAQAFAAYAATLQEDRRVLLSRYEYKAAALKVVGVGSVGTVCAVGLFVAADAWPLLLQVKEAQPSVLATYGGAAPSAYANHGERVVVGQRMMQAATDVFLGWAQTPVAGRAFYIRRLKDSRLADIGTMFEQALPFYADLCGRTLARAHSRSGQGPAIAGYLGHGASFDEAVADFAMAYADQTERDWQAFKEAIADGRIP
jgi:uncharacterized protein (DUF2252 family)